MMAVHKQLMKRILQAFGLEIHRRQSGAPEMSKAVPRASLSGALGQMTSLGFKPETIIDVGVAFETPELYREFKDAKILLIEPLIEFEPFLQKICQRYKAQYVLAAAGESSGTAIINVHRDQLDCSSLLREVEGPGVDGVPRQVPVVTVDQLCSEKQLKGPYLLKADVQGAELKVLAGATNTLRETEAIVLEVTLFGTMLCGPQVFDVMSRMKELGFVLYDLWGFSYRPFDNALCQMDAAFVREGGFFRESHVFATPEQRKKMAFSLEGHRSPDGR